MSQARPVPPDDDVEPPELEVEPLELVLPELEVEPPELVLPELVLPLELVEPPELVDPDEPASFVGSDGLDEGGGSLGPGSGAGCACLASDSMVSGDSTVAVAHAVMRAMNDRETVPMMPV
jgi:hypothetical protein